MKKFNTQLFRKFFVVILVLITLVTTSSFAAIQATYFIDPVNGNDANSGTTLTSPFKSIDKARTVVRTINSSMTGDIYVYLRGGNYTLTSTVTFTELDGGSNGYKVFYKAFNNEVPIISGEKTITGWTLYDAAKNIYKASTGYTIDTRQLFVNGKRAIRARSTDTLPYSTMVYDASNVGLGYVSPKTELVTWKNITNLEMVYNEKWTNSRCGVASVAVQGASVMVTMKQPGFRYLTTRGLTSVKTPWYYENAYELLDDEGEWYLDKTGAINGTANTFYYKPYNAENMASVVVEAPVLEKLIVIQGASIGTPVSNINFEGINLSYTTWLNPNFNTGHSDAQNNVLRQTSANMFIPSGAAVTLKYAGSINFERCNFSRLGCTGINMYAGCQNNLIQGCTFKDIAANGVQIGDYKDWSVSTSENYILQTDARFILKNNDVINNYFDKCGVEYRSSNAIGASLPQDMSIAYNEIANMPYGGTHVGWGWQQYSSSVMKNNSIKHNYIHNVLAELDDCAGIYFLGPNGSAANTTPVDSNFVRTSHDHALYFDEGSSWYTANNNVYDDIVSVNINISTPDKHDIHITNTYADDNTYWNKGTNCTVSPINVVTNGNWPATAQNVIKDAGLQYAYADIRGTDYLRETFNFTPVGSVPSGWITNTSGGTIDAIDVLNNGDRSIKLQKTITANNLSITKSFTPVSGYVVIEYKAKSDETTSWKNASYIFDKNGLPALSIIFKDGNIQVYKGPGNYTTLQTFTANTWYDIKIAMNTESKKLDIYVNDVLKLAQDNFRNPVSDIAQIQFAIGNNLSGTLYYNDVRVYADLNFVNENYNTATTNTSPYGWETTSAGTITVAELPSTTDKSVKINKTSTTGYLNSTKTFAPTSGKVYVCAKVRTEATTDWKGVPTIMDRNGVIAASLIFKDGNIQLYYGSGSYVMVQPFVAGAWYNFKIVLNTYTNKLDVYVDSVLKVSQANFRNDVADISQVQFGIGANFIGTVYYDDVQVFLNEGGISTYATLSKASNETIVSDITPENSFKLFPNPSSSQFKLAITAKEKQTATITITDFAGRTLKIFNAHLIEGNQIINLNTAELATGIYNVTTLFTDKQLTQRLIKQ